MAAREPYNVTARTAAAETPQSSQWHSTVPYLFGGLAAMLGTIAFALLILACSYWKLSGYIEEVEGSGGSERDLEAGERAGKGGEVQKLPAVTEEKILVIMAGQVKATHLATPMSSRTSSFEDRREKSCCFDEKHHEKAESGGGGGLVKQEGDVQVRIGSTVNHEESSDQTH